MEFRGAAAIGFMGVVVLVTFIAAGFAFWWVSQEPRVSSRLPQRLIPLFWGSVVLGLVTSGALLVWAVIWLALGPS